MTSQVGQVTPYTGERAQAGRGLLGAGRSQRRASLLHTRPVDRLVALHLPDALVREVSVQLVPEDLARWKVSADKSTACACVREVLFPDY